jgi:hypothetical protein
MFLQGPKISSFAPRVFFEKHFQNMVILKRRYLYPHVIYCMFHFQIHNISISNPVHQLKQIREGRSSSKFNLKPTSVNS